MSPLRARVEKGRLVLDEPTTLPEGTVADDEGDDLTNEERRALHELCRHHGNPLRKVVFGQPREFWTSCAAGGEPSRSNHT